MLAARVSRKAITLSFRAAASSHQTRPSEDPTAAGRSELVDDWRGAEPSTSGLPEGVYEIEEVGGEALSEEELAARKDEAVRSWLTSRLGEDKVELVKLLQKHRAGVRGGNEEGQRFIEALMEWKQRR